jgi:tetratricopeptide (TPR) repeat protein
MLCFSPSDESEPRRGLSVRALAFQQALNLSASGRAAEAAAQLERALAEHGRDPGASRILAELAGAYEDAGRPESAFQAYIQCAELSFGNWEELFQKATALLTPSVAAAVAPFLERRYGGEAGSLPNPAPPKSETLLLLAKLAAALKNYERAIEIARRAAIEDSSDSFRTRVADTLYSVAVDNRGAAPHIAEAALEAAIEAAPSHAASYWLLLEILRLKSYTKESPYVSPPDVNRALELWERASRAFGATWSISTRGLLNEQLAKMPGAKRWALAWEELCMLERSAARGYSGPADICNIGRVFRELGLRFCESYFTAAALRLATSPDDRRSVIEDRIITTTNLGLWEEALALVQEKRLNDPTRWTDGVEAFILFSRGDPARALALVDESIRLNPDSGWCLELRADCFRELGRADDMRKQLRTIVSQFRPEGYENVPLLARSHYWLGVESRDFTAATALLEPLLQSEDNPVEAATYFSLGQCRLAAGRTSEGLDLLREGIHRCANTRELRDLRRALVWTPRLMGDATAGREFENMLEQDGSPLAGIERRIRELDIATLRPEEELAEIVARRGADDAEGWLWCAVQATLARLHTEGGRTGDAIAIYQQIRLRAPERFPEAELRLQKLNEGRLKAAGELLATDPWSALREYAQLLEMPGALSPARRIEAVVATAFGLAVSGPVELAVARAAEAAQLEPERAALPMRMAALIRNDQQFWAVWDVLSAAKLDPAPLQGWLSCRAGAGSSASGFVPPIVIEIGERLIPADPSDNWVMIRRLIPEMRQRLKAAWGVTIPGIRLRGNLDLKDREYSIRLNEIPLPRELSIAPLSDPGATDDPDCDPALEAIIRHAEAVVTAHLDELLSFDDVEILLENLADDKAKALRDSVLPSPRARFLFARLLRELVRFRCPIVRLEEILAALRDLPLEPSTLPFAVRRVRRRLRRGLPGNGDGWLRIRLPLELERDAYRIGREEPAALEQGLRVVERIRELLRNQTAAGDHSAVALVTGDYQTAAGISELIRTEFPAVAVLCAEEIYEPSEQPQLT